MIYAADSLADTYGSAEVCSIGVPSKTLVVKNSLKINIPEGRLHL